MKTRTDIINDLKVIVRDNNLQGAVSDELVNILSYYIYEQQAYYSSVQLESSIRTCRSINSFIAHVMGYMYSALRPENGSIYLLSDELIDPSISNNTIFYDGNNFKLVYDSNSVLDLTTMTQNVSDNYEYRYMYKLRLVDNLYNITYGQLDDLLVSGNYLDLSSDNSIINNICNDLLGGDLVASGYITEDWSEYYDAVMNKLPKVFLMTTTNYGIRLYFNDTFIDNILKNSPSDKVALIVCTYSSYQLTSQDMNNIRISNTGSTELLSSRWSNNNDVTDYYNKSNPGSYNNPLSYGAELISNTYYPPVLLASGLIYDIRTQRVEFDNYLGNKFNSSSEYNIIKLFKEITSTKYANLISAISEGADNIKGNNINVPINIGEPIYSVAYSSVGLRNDYVGIDSDSKPNINKVTSTISSCYGFDWMKYSLFGSDYLTSDNTANTGIKFLLVPTKDLHIEIKSSGNYSEAANLGSNIINELKDTYANGLLLDGQDGSGRRIYDYDVIKVLKKYLDDSIISNITSINFSLSDVGAVASSYGSNGVGVLVEGTEGSNHYGADPSMYNTDNGLKSYYLRCPDYYLFINDIIIKWDN